MTPYARALMQFAFAAMAAGRRVEVFCFGTRLTRVDADAAHQGPGPRAPRDRAHRRGLGGRHADRRVAEGVARRLEPAHGAPRFGRGDLLRRARARRPGRCCASRWRGCAGSCTAGRWVNPLKGSRRGTNRSRAGWPRRCRRSTCSCRATTSRASRSWRASSPTRMPRVGEPEEPHGQVRRMGRLTEPADEVLLTYGGYLAVPELLELQRLRSDPRSTTSSCSSPSTRRTSSGSSR